MDGISISCAGSDYHKHTPGPQDSRLLECAKITDLMTGSGRWLHHPVAAQDFSEPEGTADSCDPSSPQSRIGNLSQQLQTSLLNNQLFCGLTLGSVSHTRLPPR